jgi:hypothetical protein
MNRIEVKYKGLFMPANDALLFIDANVYLDLYRRDKGKKLLAPLIEQVDYIFVTQQVVAEVQRNKISVAAAFLLQKFKELNLQTFDVPDHLSGTVDGQNKDILNQMREIKKSVEKVNKEINALALGIMEQISCSGDEVSTALSPIFENAVNHSPEELQRARDRREIGNPPGKSTDPIGDQLTWEQILTHFQGKKRLWIISKDSDYGTIYGGKGILNHFLYNELRKVVSSPEVYFFQDVVEGLNHFVNTTSVKAEKRLTPEDEEEIKTEERSLPYLILTNEEMRQMMADVLESLPSNEEMRQTLKSQLSNKQIRQTLITALKSQPSNEAMSQTLITALKPLLSKEGGG